MQQFEKKIPVAILGATGTVGQRFIQLLTNHPWFKIAALGGSEASRGNAYQDVVNWMLPDDLPESVGEMIVQPLTPDLPARLIFSALPTTAARTLEPEFAAAGYSVCSNAAAYRQTSDIPLLIPELNASHISLIEHQKAKRGWSGFIVTSPNCSTTGIVLPLKPLVDAFGIEAITSTTLQAISGAGYPGIPAFDISNNVYPYIRGEEEKIESETQILLGSVSQTSKEPYPALVSAQTNRVNVIDGHMASTSIRLGKKASEEDVYQVWDDFNAKNAKAKLPSSPPQTLIIDRQVSRPQPRLDANRGLGMSVSVGQLRACPVFDFKMTSLVHNTLRGAAGGAILNAELLVDQGLVS